MTAIRLTPTRRRRRAIEAKLKAFRDALMILSVEASGLDADVLAAGDVDQLKAVGDRLASAVAAFGGLGGEVDGEDT